ncbi:MAG: hypothetical protein FWF91_04570, partial [Coriobacteriia bacterium]|nr:hypothetical protein [Coriobacteriia bacterium]
WEQAVHPERLDGKIPISNPVQLDPVVEAGLAALTQMVNHSNNLAGVLDHRDAVAVLTVLRKGGYSLPADQVYAWALCHDWPGAGAERLQEMAAKIDAGHTMHIDGDSPFRSDILEVWRDESV